MGYCLRRALSATLRRNRVDLTRDDYWRNHATMRFANITANTTTRTFPGHHSGNTPCSQHIAIRVSTASARCFQLRLGAGPPSFSLALTAGTPFCVEAVGPKALCEQLATLGEVPRIPAFKLGEAVRRLPPPKLPRLRNSAVNRRESKLAGEDSAEVLVFLSICILDLDSMVVSLGDLYSGRLKQVQELLVIVWLPYPHEPHHIRVNGTPAGLVGVPR